MAAVSTSAVTTVEDTSFGILTGIFVSSNRSKGASIDDRARWNGREKRGGREGKERAETRGISERYGRPVSRRVYLSSKQKMRARRRRSEESQQQQQQRQLGEDERRRRRRWRRRRRRRRRHHPPHPSRRRAASIVYLPTATQYSFAKGCEGPPRRSLSQSHFDSR